MELNFCKKCDNLMYLYKEDTTDVLFHCCKACMNTEKIEDTIKKVYTNTNSNIDKGETINNNPYITHDITIPSIIGNSNIKCQNKDCDAESSNIKYIKYDEINMKYIYICNHCGYKWKNNL